MEWNTISMAAVGIAVCCLGFLRRPKNSLELLSARFVVPLMVVSAVFAQVLWYGWRDDTINVYRLCRVDMGFDAVCFAVLCMVCFWAGYMVPAGRWASRLLLPLAIPVTPGKSLSTAAHVMCGVYAVVYILTIFLPEEMLLIPGIKVISIILIFVSATLLGLSFPEKRQRNLLHLPVLLFCLLIITLPLMSTFSRGVGITVLVAAAAFSVRLGRINWLGIGLATVFAIIGVQVAFGGRGTVGHYAGALAWAAYLLSGSFISDWSTAISAAMYANDSFTPLCVSMKAAATTNVFALTPSDWLIFQIPVPHVFLFSQAYTLQLTEYLGGTGSWGYTPSMFGDVWVHLGWAGAAMFAIVGLVYRAFDELAFHPTPEGTLNPFFLLLVFGYFAMAAGLFNSFRSWNTGTTDGIMFVSVLLFLRKVLVPSDGQGSRVHDPYLDLGAPYGHEP
jgi:hypothetical protein